MSQDPGPLKARRWGGALASTLLIVLFLTVFAFTLANLATFDLRTVSRNSQTQAAFEAAQTGLDSAVSEILKDPEFGKNGEGVTGTLADGSTYEVTFDSSRTDVPFSFNNLDSFNQVTSGYNGRPIPPFHASVFATGRSSNGETSLVECLIRLEAIPYTVAGTSEVDMRNSLVSAPGDEEANVYSGKAGEDSLVISGLSRVDGDARSVGQINAPNYTIGGDRYAESDPETLPDLNITDFNNSEHPGINVQVPGLLSLPLSGQHYIPGDATFGVGMVMLDATVYVDGDLTVTALAGSGTIFVRGKTNVIGTAVTLQGSDRLTLFSGDDINFALPLVPSIVQGVFFSRGNINITGSLQMLGAIYAINKDDPSKGNVSLGNTLSVVTVTHLDQSTAFANFWIAKGGQAKAIRVYWRRLR